MKGNEHAWFSGALFGLTALILGLVAWKPALADNHLFATLAQGIVLTGFVNLAASFYFGASKNQPPHTFDAGAPTPPPDPNFKEQDQ